MKITTSVNYRHEYVCDLDLCERHYCRGHRLLWRDCDSAQEGIDEYYLDGRPHYVYEYGECPECERETVRGDPTAPPVFGQVDQDAQCDGWQS